MDELDKLIDEVARDMTSAPPRDGLTRRVSMRIAAGDGVRSAWRLPRPWVLVPIASACVLLLAVFVARQGSVQLKPDAVPVAPDVGRPFEGRRGGADSPAPQEAARAGDPERVAPRNRQAQASPELPAPTLEPIPVDRLELQPIVEMTAIDIRPIDIDRIEITAMP